MLLSSGMSIPIVPERRLLRLLAKALTLKSRSRMAFSMAERFSSRRWPPLKYFDMVERESPVRFCISLYVPGTGILLSPEDRLGPSKSFQRDFEDNRLIALNGIRVNMETILIAFPGWLFIKSESLYIFNDPVEKRKMGSIPLSQRS